MTEIDGGRDRIDRMRKKLVERAVDGPGQTSAHDRRGAFDNQGAPAAATAIVDTVARHAWRVTDEDIEAAKRAGLDDDAIFELVVCAALGQATRRLDAALALLGNG